MALMKSDYMKEYGANAILKPIIEDIKKLVSFIFSDKTAKLYHKMHCAELKDASTRKEHATEHGINHEMLRCL